MHARTNDIKKATAYQRESAGRTASERLLDQHYKQNHERISKLETQLMISSQPTKKAKIEQKEQGLPTAEEALAKVVKHLTSEGKLTKCLELLKKLIGSEAFKEISSASFLDAWLRLLNVVVREGSQLRIRQQASAFFTEANEWMVAETDRKSRSLSERENELWDLLKLFGVEFGGLWADDNFHFSKTLAAFQKHIADFDADFSKLNQLEALSQLKLETSEAVKKEPGLQCEQQPEKAEIPASQCKLILQATSSDQLLLFKRGLIFQFVCRLFPLASTSWRKPSLSVFLREFSTSTKDRMLNKKQKEVFAEQYQQYLNSKIKGSFNEQLQFKVDRAILSTPLNSHHEVKDNRREFFTGDAADRWSNRQS